MKSVLFLRNNLNSLTDKFKKPTPRIRAFLEFSDFPCSSIIIIWNKQYNSIQIPCFLQPRIFQEIQTALLASLQSVATAGTRQFAADRIAPQKSGLACVHGMNITHI